MEAPDQASVEAPGQDSAGWVRVRAEPLPEGQGPWLADLARALGDPRRIEILHLLAVADGPVCVLDFEHHLGVAQSTASHHLKALVDAGICDRESRGRWSYYTLRRRVLADFRHRLEDLVHFPVTRPASGNTSIDADG